MKSITPKVGLLLIFLCLSSCKIRKVSGLIDGLWSISEFKYQGTEAGDCLFVNTIMFDGKKCIFPESDLECLLKLPQTVKWGLIERNDSFFIHFQSKREIVKDDFFVRFDMYEQKDILQMLISSDKLSIKCYRKDVMGYPFTPRLKEICKLTGGNVW